MLLDKEILGNHCLISGKPDFLPQVPGGQAGRKTLFWARSYAGVMDYDEACFMHLTPGVVHNFPKAVGV